MGRPKGSKNKPKPPPPEIMDAVEWAKRNGYKPPTPPPAGATPAVVGIPADFREFLKLVKIRAKRGGKLITPVLNAEQEELLAAWESGDEDGLRHLLVLKPRKIGVSTFFALLFTHKFLTSEDPVTLVSLANTQPVATEIMQIVKTAIASLPDALRPVLTTNQVRKIAREDPNNPGVDGCTYIVDTARAERPMAGFTPYWLHLSEAAFCKNPDELRASAFSAVPWDEGGRIAMESTASHIGDLLHEQMKAAQSGIAEVPWKPIFFAWHRHEKYRRPAIAFERTAEEERLAEKYELSDEQLAWRRQMMATVGERKFPREFPADLEDAYSSLEGQWIQASQVEHLEVIDIAGDGIAYLEEYDPNETYGAAVDCATGTGTDASTCVILNARTKRPAVVWRSTTAAPTEGADVVWQLLCQYGNAKVLVERNIYGIPYLNALRALRANMYEERAHETDGQMPSGEAKDFTTSEKTRVEVLDDFKTHVLSGALPAIDSVCAGEMRAAKVNRDGKVVFPRTAKAGHGDVLFAYALALRCLRHVPVPASPPTLSERRSQDLRRKRLLSDVAYGSRY